MANDKVKKWNNARRKLKILFAAQGITRCEMCQSTFALSFSHKQKRRFITTEEQLFDVVLLCAHHHEFIENHPQKESIHNSIIQWRSNAEVV